MVPWPFYYFTLTCFDKRCVLVNTTIIYNIITKEDIVDFNRKFPKQIVDITRYYDDDDIERRKNMKL